MGTLSPFLTRSGNNLLSLQEQPNGRMAWTEYGMAYYQCQFICDRDQCYALAPRQYEPHPRFPNLGNIVQKMTITERETDALIACQYAGYWPNFGSLSYPQAFYEVLGSVSAEPIETHPNFKDPTFAGSAESPSPYAIFNQQGLFVGFKPSSIPASGPPFISPFAGVKNYLQPGCTIRVSWVWSERIYDLSCRGRIISPPGNWIITTGWETTTSSGDSTGDITTANWLCVGFSQRIQGLVNQVAFDFKASGPAGWNPKIYKTGSLPIPLPPPQ